MESKGLCTRVMLLEPFLLHQQMSTVASFPDQPGAATCLPAQTVDPQPMHTDDVLAAQAQSLGLLSNVLTEDHIDRMPSTAPLLRLAAQQHHCVVILLTIVNIIV